MTYQTIYPYTGELLETFENHTDQDVEATLTTAHNLYKQWRNEPIASRRPILQKVADSLRKNADELASIITHDMGKLVKESKGEVLLCADIAEYYANESESLLKPVPLESPAGEGYYAKQSTGVIMAVEPWNFPFYQIMRVFAPNFMVGNPMILKDASVCPKSAKVFADIVKEAGAPEGSLTNLFINYQQVADIIADKRVSGVCLTGSERGGAVIAKTAGENLKKTTLELGGNDAFIILDDADWDLVKEIAPQARLDNAGQVCTSSKRFIVMEDKYEEFLEILKESFANQVLGDPMDENTTVAPLSSKSAQTGLQKQVQMAIDHGATVVYGNEPVDQPGFFFMPTILTDITPDNPIFDQEMFGPVATVYKVKNTQEAIELANNSSYGLGNSIIGQDLEKAQKVALQIETGMSWINSAWGTLPELPFGGIKNSGFGRELGELGLNAFVNEHLVFVPKK